MIRVLAVLLGAGLVLSACGSISASQAMTNWVVQSGFIANAKSLTNDAKHSALALRDPSTSDASLRTVCAVLDLETEQANAALPTPDNQATTLLSRALNTLGAGAVECYGASSNVATRARALRSLSNGAADLAEASARVANVIAP
ncbi:MAG: hypothetical protein ACYDB2_09915 [Acidimicrobiales bacterium]